jgi:hypothetical protein
VETSRTLVEVSVGVKPGRSPKPDHPKRRTLGSEFMKALEGRSTGNTAFSSPCPPPQQPPSSPPQSHRGTSAPGQASHVSQPLSPRSNPPGRAGKSHQGGSLVQCQTPTPMGYIRGFPRRPTPPHPQAPHLIHEGEGPDGEEAEDPQRVEPRLGLGRVARELVEPERATDGLRAA